MDGWFGDGRMARVMAAFVNSWKYPIVNNEAMPYIVPISRIKDIVVSILRVFKGTIIGEHLRCYQAFQKVS